MLVIALMAACFMAGGLPMIAIIIGELRHQRTIRAQRRQKLNTTRKNR